MSTLKKPLEPLGFGNVGGAMSGTLWETQLETPRIMMANNWGPRLVNVPTQWSQQPFWVGIEWHDQKLQADSVSRQSTLSKPWNRGPQERVHTIFDNCVDMDMEIPPRRTFPFVRCGLSMFVHVCPWCHLPNRTMCTASLLCCLTVRMLPCKLDELFGR